MRSRIQRQGRKILAAVFWVLAIGALIQPARAAKSPDADKTAAASTSASASVSASMAPAPSAVPVLAPASNVSLPSMGPRRNAPKPKPPSAQQMQAFNKLSDEAKIYSESAKHFRRTLTMIVRHHYEEHR